MRTKAPPFDFCICLNRSCEHGIDPCLMPSAVNEHGQFLHDRLCIDCAQKENDDETDNR